MRTLEFKELECCSWARWCSSNFADLHFYLFDAVSNCVVNSLIDNLL